jgi:hypothetical protein
MQHGAFDDLPDHIRDAVFSDIADQLLEDWINNLLDESQYFADFQIAAMSNDPMMKQKFNQFYELNPEHDDYLEVE